MCVCVAVAVRVCAKNLCTANKTEKQKKAQQNCAVLKMPKKIEHFYLQIHRVQYTAQQNFNHDRSLFELFFSD